MTTQQARAPEELLEELEDQVARLNRQLDQTSAQLLRTALDHDAHTAAIARCNKQLAQSRKLLARDIRKPRT